MVFEVGSPDTASPRNLDLLGTTIWFLVPGKICLGGITRPNVYKLQGKESKGKERDRKGERDSFNSASFFHVFSST